MAEVKESVERVTGQRVDAVRAVSAGRSSQAWIAHVGQERWVVRVPIEDSGRRITYQAEATIGRYLGSLGHPVAEWTIVSVNGSTCSVARQIPGVPVVYDQAWSSKFGHSVGRLLGDLHAMPAERFGPLEDHQVSIRGVSDDRVQGVADRWCHARMWPFDGESLDDHPIIDHAPEIGNAAISLAERIKAAEAGASGVVHSDLHQEHLLVDENGSLAGVLDFGDAFVGSVAWDFALLNWYHGKANASLVARHYPDGSDALDRGIVLSIAVGLYKMAKNPNDLTVIPRLRRCLESI